MKIFNIILFLCSYFLSFSQTQKDLEAIVENGLPNDGLTGFYFENNNTKEVHSLNAEIPMIPASAWKVFSTYSAYKTLKKDFQFETNLYYTGEILSDGTLQGNLLLIGGGDPTLARTQKELADFVQQCISHISKAGINCVDGSVVIDASILGDEILCPSWPWIDIGNYYSSGTWGINVLENYVELEFQLQNDLSARPLLRSVTPSTPMRFDNRLMTGPKGSGDQAYVFGAPFQSYRIIRGTLPLGSGSFKIKGAMSCPPCHLHSVLINEMKRQNIEVNDSYVKFEPSQINDSKQLLFSSKSSSINFIIKEALVKSNNLFCEGLLRMATVQNADNGNYKNVAEQISHSLENILGKGHRSNGFDGSGLSPQNRATAQELSQIIKYIDHNDVAFMQLIPTADKSSIAKYLKSDLRHQVRVKSGYMNSVWTYTGALINSKKETIYFSVMFNGRAGSGRDVRRVLGSLISYMADH